MRRKFNVSWQDCLIIMKLVKEIRYMFKIYLSIISRLNNKKFARIAGLFIKGVLHALLLPSTPKSAALKKSHGNA